ncbi:hypothetical protein WG628_20765 [Stenotrophomonas maltophilia]
MRLLSLLPALLLLTTLPAAADALRCGEYRVANGATSLVFTTPSSGYRHNSMSEPEPLWVDRSAAQTRLVMLDDGISVPIRISADGQRIEDDVQMVYTLRRPRACAVEPSAEPGSCRAAGSYCIVQLPSASPAQAQRACSEGVGAGCSALLQQQLESSTAVATDGAGSSRFERPPACREHTPTHDPQACEALTDDDLAAAMRRVGQRLEQAEKAPERPPLPLAALQQLQPLCLRHRAGRFCVELAEQQLKALQPALAVQALQVVCDGGRVSACERTAPLRALGADLRLVPLQQVPCGRYQTDEEMPDRLDFGDGSQARLHDGAVHLQRDGETLVLRQLGNGDLLGMDTQTGYQRYRPVSGTAQCSPPREGRGLP